jgi:putative ABC transport system ATP-binding protein
MLTVQDVSYSIGGKAILDRISFNLASGKHLLLLGESGTGKTTLMSLLTGLLTPGSGRILFDTTDLSSLTPTQADRFRGKHMSIVLQGLHLIKPLTVWQNVTLGAELPNIAFQEEQLHHVLERLGLSAKKNQRAQFLSFGEAQRVAFARAIIKCPRWIFCDEPTSALDDKHAFNLLEILKREAALCEASLIIATHDQRTKSFFSAAEILELKA